MTFLTEDAKKVYDALSTLKPVECNDLLNIFARERYNNVKAKFFCCVICETRIMGKEEFVQCSGILETAESSFSLVEGHEHKYSFNIFCPITLCDSCLFLTQRKNLVHSAYSFRFDCLEHVYDATLFDRLYAKLVFTKVLPEK